MGFEFTVPLNAFMSIWYSMDGFWIYISLNCIHECMVQYGWVLNLH